MRTLIVFGLLSLSCVSGLFLSNFQYTCCGPDDVWEADEGFMMGLNMGGGVLTQAFSRLSMTNSGRMVSQYMDETTNGTSRKYRILQDFRNSSQKMQYTIMNGSCSAEPIPYDFVPSCVEANATKVQSSFYGTPDRPYRVDTYKTNIQGLDSYVTVHPNPVDPHICVPVGSISYGQYPINGTMVGVMQTYSFTNYRKGTNDPHVFDIPPECTKATMQNQANMKTHRLRRSVFA